jgi:hypothetical protein
MILFRGMRRRGKAHVAAGPLTGTLKLARSSKSVFGPFDDMDTGSDPVRRGGFMPGENE